ncbi:MAG: hypothetical protein HY686_04265 [Chloroflexi bacterium]|nr:hypothetical protein [Chloroflexota bacterium]
MHDGITLEKRGIPTAVICTEPFISSAKAMAQLGGIPDYPYAVVQHPIGSLTPEGLRERARQALPQVLELLLAQKR